MNPKAGKTNTRAERQPTATLYTTRLNRDPFLYFELKQAAQLKQHNLSFAQIREKVSAENLFQCGRPKTTRNRLDSVLERLAVLDDELQRILCQGSSEIGKIVTLYSIYQTDRLFAEFLQEVVAEKLQIPNSILLDQEVRAFFQVKAEQSATVASWQASSLNKLRQVYKKILVDAGLSQPLGKINRHLLSPDLRNHLTDLGAANFVRLLEGK
jgi:hypothetical protein